MTKQRAQLLQEAADDCESEANNLLNQAPNMGRTKEQKYREEAEACIQRALALRAWAKELQVEPTPVLDHRHIPDRDDPGFCAKCGSTRASHSEPTESLIDQKERLRKTIDKVILTVDFDQACLCSRCTAMRELQQAALASVEPPFKPAMTTCGSCGQHYDLNQGHNCPDFYAK